MRTEVRDRDFSRFNPFDFDVDLFHEDQEATRVDDLELDGFQRDEELASAPARRKRKIAIVGGGPSRKKAPFKDRSWEIWAFSSRKARYPRVNRWFEIHHLTDLRQQLAGRKRGRRTFKGYMRFLKRLKCPVYMQKQYRFIPRSVAFPKKEVIAAFGRCFTSTASYMIALAILEGCDVIGLWGVDVRHKRYNYQRPALRYLLGLARKYGIKIVMARSCAIRIPKKPKFVKTKVLYAYDWKSPHAWWRDRVRRRLRLKRGKKALRRRLSGRTRRRLRARRRTSARRSLRARLRRRLRRRMRIRRRLRRRIRR